MAKRRPIYTRRGDLGETALYGGPRVAKDSPRIETCGVIDELNAHLGLARSELAAVAAAGALEWMDDILRRVQGELFEIGGELNCPDPVRFKVRRVDRPHIERLEHDIDRLEVRVPPQTTFLLPSGTKGACVLHVARTVCRRAERQVIRLMRVAEEDVSRASLAYLNRLADLLYVMARVANVLSKTPEEAWTPPAEAGDGEEA